MRRLTTSALDLAGAGLVIAFCAVTWWPSALLVGGLALLAASWKATR